jgi:hypothetical protein
MLVIEVSFGDVAFGMDVILVRPVRRLALLPLLRCWPSR